MSAIIIEKVNHLISLCDQITKDVFSENSTAESIQQLCTEFPNFITALAEAYSTPAYASHEEDIPAWVSLFQSLVNGTNSVDILNFLDIISYEIKENLVEVKNIFTSGV